MSVGFQPAGAYVAAMATRADYDRQKAEGAEDGYDAWKRAKIMRGLEQSRDRSVMIPIEQIWCDLELER